MIKFFSPLSLLSIYIVWIVLSIIPNALGWSSKYDYDVLSHTPIYLTFLMAIVVAYMLTKKGENVSIKIFSSDKQILRLQFVFYFSVFIYIMKFIKVGDIPLISDNPLVRTRTALLGGYVDYPTKLITITNMLFMYLYLSRKKKLYFAYVAVGLCLHLLFADRTQLVFSLIGIIFISLKNYSIGLKKFVAGLSFIAVLFMIIAGVQMSRHGGAEKLYTGSDFNLFEIGLWVIHGDLTGSQKFGSHIINNLDGEHLNGRYTLGAYASVVIPNFKDHGAEYLRRKYTNSLSAQSAGAPLSYYIDFGFLFVFIPLVIGIILKKTFTAFKYESQNVSYFLYIILFTNILWSFRSGNIPIDPIFLYFGLSLFFIFRPYYTSKLKRLIIEYFRFIFLLSVFVSLLFLLIRF